MRILKEYSALSSTDNLTDENSIGLKLLLENGENVIKYIENSTNGIDVNYKILNSLKIAAGDIFKILAQNADIGEEVRIACSYHRYYFMLVFEFSESALPLHTLNKSVKVLDLQNQFKNTQDETGFMNIVHLVDRISLSIDKISEKMRITIIKEKRYPAPDVPDELPVLGEQFKIYENDDNTAIDFSKQLYKRFGDTVDNFLIYPQLFVDNLNVNELDAIFLNDENGHCVGGTVWHKANGIVVLMIFTIFLPPESKCFNDARDMLLDEFNKKAKATDASFIVSKIQHSELISGFFDSCDEKYYYKSLSKQKKHTSYIKPELMPLIKKAYQNFEISREIREINYNYSFLDPYSVLTTKIDVASSEAVLSILLFGDDLKSNIIRHVTALKKIGINDVFFRLDLGVPEEAAVSDLIQSCGFEVQYLWPYSSSKGDIIIFLYIENTVYENKPCEIFPINKENIEKTPELVRKVYSDNYPSQYLYNPEELWQKIRKRNIYPYIAIDDEKKAVGMIAFTKPSNNPYLLEVGQLMVDPKHRGTNVVSQLIEYIYSTAMNGLDFDAVLSESVTNHKLSQRSCINSGFCDTALKLNIMSARAFDLEEERRRIGRMSCVVSCIERADETFTVYLPAIYAEQIKYCFEGLKPRFYEIAKDITPKSESITEYLINDDEAETSMLINVTILKIGADIENVIERLEHYALNKNIKSMLVNIPLSDNCNAFAVKALKTYGFFFGGVIPYWLSESDILLMQKLYDNSPDWDNIKLFSRKIKQIAKFIKEDMV